MISLCPVVPPGVGVRGAFCVSPSAVPLDPTPSCLLHSVASFAVAWLAGGYQVVPVVGATSHERDHMVHRTGAGGAAVVAW